jgi:hypothetical protein
VRDEELCITPDTIDELLIALQTSADASLDSQNTPCNMYTHVINSGSRQRRTLLRRSGLRNMRSYDAGRPGPVSQGRIIICMHMI